MNSRALLLISLALVLAAAVAPMPAAAQDAGVNTTSEASIAIDQPEYVDGDVRTTSDNGSRIYEAQGSPLRIAPQNFDPEDVVNYGVETGAGQLDYDENMRYYRFDPSGETGTFRLFWVANTQVTVEEGGNTTTEVRQVRHTTRVRVTEAVSMHHLSNAEYQQRQEMVELGEYTNETVGTVQERNLWAFDTSGSDREVIERMATRVQATGAPFSALTGGASQFVLLLFLSLGGAFIGGTMVVAIVYYMVKWYREHREREAIRAVEGELDVRELDVEERERMAALANTPWTDVFEDDHVAAGMREQFGDTLLSGWMALQNTLLPENVVRDRLVAMGKAGYVAVPGGEGGYDVVEESTLDVEEPTAGEDYERLTPPSDDILEAIDWNAAEIRTFDLSEADVDPGDVDLDTPTLSLPELIERLDVQRQHWESDEEFGAYLYDFVESVRTSEFCDAQGRPSDVRAALESFLHIAQLADDRHNFPVAGYWSDAFEFALCDYDRADQISSYVENVQSGAGADD